MDGYHFAIFLEQLFAPSLQKEGYQGKNKRFSMNTERFQSEELW
jgi:hypothetical protein